jgi:hypothetical protein
MITLHGKLGTDEAPWAAAGTCLPRPTITLLRKHW